jgi:hypothetical protein
MVSRGHGKAQRFVLDALARKRVGGFEPGRWYWMDAGEIAAERGGHAPSAAEVESIRRAIHSLAAEGLVEAKHSDQSREGEPVTITVRAIGDDGEFTDEFEEHTYRPTRGYRVLIARIALTDEERAAEEAESEERFASFVADLSDLRKGAGDG